MNTFHLRTVMIAVVGIVAIASLSHSAIFLPDNLSRPDGASSNHEASHDGALAKTNSLAVDPRYRIPGNNGPVWPPNLPFEPNNNTNH
jgi:hypothetical protein